MVLYSSPKKLFSCKIAVLRYEDDFWIIFTFYFRLVLRYEDDPVIGHRLYREIRKVEVKKGKGRNIPPIPSSSYQWETVATNFDEFEDVSVSFLFCSLLPPFLPFFPPPFKLIYISLSGVC